MNNDNTNANANTNVNANANANANINATLLLINETYDKLTYFDLYGNSVILFIFMTLFVFVVFWGVFI